MDITIIEELIYEHWKQPYNDKGKLIDKYTETFDSVRVIDSAYPIAWQNAVAGHFGVRNVGMWAWAYGVDGSNFRHGAPIPCCKRALAYLDAMIGTDSPLVFSEHYQFNPYRYPRTTP